MTGARIFPASNWARIAEGLRVQADGDLRGRLSHRLARLALEGGAARSRAEISCFRADRLHKHVIMTVEC